MFFLLGREIALCQFQVNRPVITTGSGTHLTGNVYVTSTIGGGYSTLVFPAASTTTSIQSHTALENLKVALYPCPANDKLTVSIANLINQGFKISLYDLSGELISATQYAKITSDNFTTDIDIKSISTGMYFVKVSSAGNEVYNGKFLKQ